jgi:hypothetical protein
VRTVLLVLHIVGAATWFGANIAQVVVTRRFAAEGGPPAASWMRSTIVLGRNVYGPAGFLVLVTGVWLVLDSTLYGFGDAFVGIGITVVLIGIILGITVFGPRGARAAQAFAEGDDAGGRKIVAGIAGFGVLDTLLVLLAITAMVGKWGV